MLFVVKWDCVKAFAACVAFSDFISIVHRAVIVSRQGGIITIPSTKRIVSNRIQPESQDNKQRALPKITVYGSIHWGTKSFA